MASRRDPRVVKAVFDVWLTSDMIFNNPPGQNLKNYRKHTKAKKVRYTKKIIAYLDRMEDKDIGQGDRVAVAIRLDDKVRYVWRERVLSKNEYDAIKAQQSYRLRMLRKKS